MVVTGAVSKSLVIDRPVEVKAVEAERGGGDGLSLDPLVAPVMSKDSP